MKGLERNKKTFWYANPTGTEPIYDEYGNEAGAKTLYEKPKKYKISP